MKKLTLLYLIFVFAGAVHAQIFFRAGGGYALPVATETLGEKNIAVSNQNGGFISNTSESVKGTYGAGFNFNVGAGYMFSKHIGAELNFSYLMGKEFEYSTAQALSDGSAELKLQVTEKSKAFYITPSLILSTGQGSKVPYAKVGVVFGMPEVEQELSILDRDTDGTNTASGTFKIQKGLSLGFSGAVGMNWMISNHIDILTEINFIGMTYYPKERVLTSAVANGEKQDLSDYNEYTRKTVYKEKINVQENPDLDKPQEALQESMPFSSLSLQVGVVYFLSRNLD